MSTFSGLNIGRSGLTTSQQSLNTVGHNIANANTPGYTRQRLEQRATIAMKTSTGSGMYGTGVEGFKTIQIRDEYLDTKYRNELTPLGEWDYRASMLSEMEAIMNEPSETGITSVMDDFFNSLQELSKDPSSLTTRAVVREKGVAFCNTINNMYSQMETMISDTDFAARTTATQINSYATDIASLNEQIYELEANGDSANDLRDQRNLLIDELSKLVDIQVIESKDGDNAGKMKILVDGHPLVDHGDTNLIDISKKTNHKYATELDYKGQVTEFRWEDGSSINTNALGGQLKAQIDIRDNMDTDGNKGVPYYLNKLNEFTKTFASAMNTQHQAGYGLDGKDGHAFFGFSSGTEISAKNICISSDIMNDLDAIAAAGAPGLPGDTSNLDAILELRHKDDMFDWGSPEDFMKSLISNLGVESSEAKRMTYNQAVLVSQVDSMRQSISGVSMDEEMGNMIKYQHAYNASARVITTVDEMIDVVINRMGRVGL